MTMAQFQAYAGGANESKVIGFVFDGGAKIIYGENNRFVWAEDVDTAKECIIEKVVLGNGNSIKTIKAVSDLQAIVLIDDNNKNMTDNWREYNPMNIFC